MCGTSFLNQETTLSRDLLAGAVLNVGDAILEGGVGAKAAGAGRLVAGVEVEAALLIDAALAEGVEDVVQLVVLGDPAAGVGQAGGDVVHAVGAREGQLAVVKEVLALGGIDELVVHGDAAALLGVLGGRLSKGKVVPGIVGDVVGAGRGVDLEDVEAAALVADLDADVGAVNRAGPVGDAVGVDLAAEDADARGVLSVGGDASRLATALRDSAGRSKSSRSGKEGGHVGKHVDWLVWISLKELKIEDRSLARLDTLDALRRVMKRKK